MIDQIHRMIEDGMTPDEIMAQHTIFVDYETVIRKSFIKKDSVKHLLNAMFEWFITLEKLGVAKHMFTPNYRRHFRMKYIWLAICSETANPCSTTIAARKSYLLMK